MTEFVITRKTELADVVVITPKRTAPNLIQSFATFVIVGQGRYATRISNFDSENAALAEHDGLVTRYPEHERRELAFEKHLEDTREAVRNEFGK